MNRNGFYTICKIVKDVLMYSIVSMEFKRTNNDFKRRTYILCLKRGLSITFLG